MDWISSYLQLPLITVWVGRVIAPSNDYIDTVTEAEEKKLVSVTSLPILTVNINVALVTLL